MMINELRGKKEIQSRLTKEAIIYSLTGDRPKFHQGLYQAILSNLLTSPSVVFLAVFQDVLEER
jgi:hypothetical protein